jgi:hypothetical protein
VSTREVADGLPEGKPKGKFGAVYRELWLLQIANDSKVAPRYFKVAFALAINMNIYTGAMYPSRETITGRISVCKRTVDRAMNCLERRGHLKRRTGPFNVAKRTREMRCWPILNRTDLSQTSDSLIRSMWTKVAHGHVLWRPSA